MRKYINICQPKKLVGEPGLIDPGLEPVSPDSRSSLSQQGGIFASVS